MSEVPTPAPHMLVAADHAALRAQIVAVLAGAGWQVDEASDGRLALQLALEQPPDVLLLDLGLPGLDGLQVCQRLRAEADRHIPVLMLTARDTLADKGNGFAAGADDYLLKPFASDELLWRCRALARRGELGRSPLLELWLPRRSTSLGDSCARRHTCRPQAPLLGATLSAHCDGGMPY